MDSTANLGMYPLDSRCTLLTNIVWDQDRDGTACLHRQKLWAAFPVPVTADGLTAEFDAAVGRVRIETAEDDAGTTWRLLADADMQASPHIIRWQACPLSNLRIHVVEPVIPSFPRGYYFSAVRLHVSEASLAALPAGNPLAAEVRLEDVSADVVERFAGHCGVHINERLGLCHDKPRTDRVRVSQSLDEALFTSPVFSLGVDRAHARLTHLGWDSFGQGRASENLLNTTHTQGAFPVVMRQCQRLSSESCGGRFSVAGRTVKYVGIRPVPEITWDYAFHVRENGFSLTIDWECRKSFCGSANWRLYGSHSTSTKQ